MNVQELMAVLSKLPLDMELILQVDDEGNGYNKLGGIDTDCVFDDSHGRGEEVVYSCSCSANDACMDEDEWQEILSRPRAGVLYP